MALTLLANIKSFLTILLAYITSTTKTLTDNQFPLKAVFSLAVRGASLWLIEMGKQRHNVVNLLAVSDGSLSNTTKFWNSMSLLLYMLCFGLI